MSPSILILFGGTSDERRVSVATAQNVAEGLPEAKLCFEMDSPYSRMILRG